MALNQNELIRKIAENSPVALEIVLLDEHSSKLSLRPMGVDVGRGFVISFATTTSVLVASFAMENFAGALLSEIGKNQADYKLHWSARWNSLEKKGATTVCQIGSSRYISPGFEVTSWSSLVLSSTKPTSGTLLESEALDFFQDFVDLALSVIPVDDFEENIGDFEGELTRVTVNKYERSRRNRQICLDTFGPNCMVCGFNFETTYGSIGQNFAEVHHIEPVSMMTEVKRLNPLTDLIVLCSNCHSMAHRKTPPYLPKELVSLVEGSGK